MYIWQAFDPNNDSRVQIKDLEWIHLQHTRIAVAFARWNFLLLLDLKKKKIKKSIGQEYYRLLAGKCDSFTRMLQINLVPRALFPGFAGGAVSQWYGHPRVLGIPIPISLAFGDAQNADRFDFA